MHDRPKTGSAMTYMMGAVGAPSVPGAHSLAELNPLQASIPVSPGPGYSPEVVVDTPLPNGNLADFDTHWAMIEEDQFPAFLDLVDNHPDEEGDIIGGEMHEHI